MLLYPLALQQNREVSVASPADSVLLFPPFCLRPPALASPTAARPPPSALMAHMCSDRNLTAFLAIAQRLNMLVVLRAGPYMCGEWEFGGLPAWLFANGSITLRTMAQPYWAHVEAWWGQHLLPAVRPMLYTNGGPVVMVQVENEYGSYGGYRRPPTLRLLCGTHAKFSPRGLWHHACTLVHCRADIGSDLPLVEGGDGTLAHSHLPTSCLACILNRRRLHEPERPCLHEGADCAGSSGAGSGRCALYDGWRQHKLHGPRQHQGL